MRKDKYVFLMGTLIFMSLLLTGSNKIYYNKQNDLEKTDKMQYDSLESSASENGAGYIMDTDASYSWIEISSTGTQMSVSNWDDGDETIHFSGWSFTFYETSYNEITVSSNGWMSFPNLGSTDYYLDHLPSMEENNFDAVALLGADLDPSSAGDIYYQFFGSAPNRYLVIEYKDVARCCDSSAMVGTFEVIFYENGNIKFQYNDVSDEIDAPLIGLDHGDFINYNVYDANTPLSSKAISFTYDQMIEWEYGFDLNVNEELYWQVLEINQTMMETAFETTTWESDWGLFDSPTEDDRMKIKIDSITANSTHWNITYDKWDWVDKDLDFPSMPDDYDKLSFRQHPEDYGNDIILPNIWPLITPNQSLMYLSRIDLDYSEYDYVNIGDDNRFLHIHHDFSLTEGYIDINVVYDNYGILQYLKVEHENEIIFYIVCDYNCIKPSHIGINEGDLYEYGVFTEKKNAPEYYRDYLDTYPERYKISINFVSGAHPITNEALIWIREEIKKEGLWSEYNKGEFMISTPLNFLDNDNEFYYWEVPKLIPRNSDYNDIITVLENGNYYDEEYVFNVLNNGFTIDRSNYYGLMTYECLYLDSGILNIFSMKHNDDVWLTFRYNDFDYEIPVDDDEDNDEAMIPGYDILLLYVFSMLTLIGILYRLKK